MKKLEVELYSFKELSDSAKGRAIIDYYIVYPEVDKNSIYNILFDSDKTVFLINGEYFKH